MSNDDFSSQAKTTRPAQPPRKSAAGGAAHDEWMREILDSAEALIGVFDAQGRLRFANQAALDTLGLSGEHALGLTLSQLSELAPDSTVDRWRSHLQQVLESRGPVRFRDHILIRDQEIWAQVVATPIHDNTDEVTAVTFVATVINEQMRIESALREQQQRMEIILRHTTDGINIVEIEEKTRRRRLVMCNDRYVEMSGRSRDELMAMEDINSLFTHPNPSYWDRIQTGSACQGRASWIRPDGKENYFEWTGAPVRIAGRLFVVGIDRDVTERIRAEKRLRQQQQQLELILRHSRDGINICRIDRRTGQRRLALCNDRYVEMSGRSREELETAENLDEFVNIIEPVDVPESRRQIRQGVPQEGVGEWVRPDGRENVYEWTAVPIFVGDELYVVGIDRDITERRRSQAALRESERRFRAVFDSSSESILLADADRRIVYVNPRACELIGLKPRQAIGMPLEAVGEQFLDARRTEVWLERFENVFDHSKTLSRTEEVEIHGRPRWVSWTLRPVVDDAGDVEAVVLLHRDITEQRRAELELLEHQQRLELIMEHSTDGINIQKVVDFDTLQRKLVLCNERYVEMSGRSRDELFAAVNTSDLTVPLHSGLAENRKRMIRGEPFDGLSSWIRPDGQENVFEWTAAPIWVDGELYLIGVDRDVTERRRAEEAIRAANRKLLSAREQERRRLARELHDSVSQSLVAMKLSLQKTLSRVNAEQLESAGEALQSTVARCDALIQEVRGICHGLYPTALESLGLVAALRGLVRDMEHGPKTTLVCDPGLSERRLAPETEIELFRVVQESLTNALRHSDAENIEIRLRCEHQRLILSVTDDGKGFDASDSAATGLGLNTMRERISSVAGRLEVISGEAGTSVRAHVPLTGPAEVEVD